MKILQGLHGGSLRAPQQGSTLTPKVCKTIAFLAVFNFLAVFKRFWAMSYLFLVSRYS